MSIVTMSDDEKWQMESDVQTLKEAELIKKDETRYEKAMQMMHEEMEAMSANMEEMARKRFPGTYKK